MPRVNQRRQVETDEVHLQVDFAPESNHGANDGILNFAKMGSRGLYRQRGIRALASGTRGMYAGGEGIFKALRSHSYWSGLVRSNR